MSSDHGGGERLGDRRNFGEWSGMVMSALEARRRKAREALPAPETPGSGRLLGRIRKGRRRIRRATSSADQS